MHQTVAISDCYFAQRTSCWRTLGGKAAGLLALRHRGFTTPDFAIVPTDDVAAAREDNLGRAAEAFISDRMNSAPLAVRSSSVLEDTAGAAGAGLGLSLLNVTGRRAILRAMRRVADSLRCDSLRSYRKRAARPPNDDSEGTVILQEMIHPTVSGVLFTCDPLTGDPSQVRIEAAYGACRQVVDGYAMVKTVVDRLTGARMVSGEDGRILPPRRIDALLEVALRHDAEFGLRHDIEFAFADDTRTGEEYLTLLQSRPVTTPLVQPS